MRKSSQQIRLSLHLKKPEKDESLSGAEAWDWCRFRSPEVAAPGRVNDESGLRESEVGAST